MIPVKLQLKNFMSYRNAEVLDFSGFDLAILNGENGVGKSTLLEAITWSLWGKARAASDDNLIHQRETSMWVEFIFDYEGNRYRVVRAREVRGKGSTTLEFQISTDHEARQKSIDGSFARSWKPLTGATIKQTQDMIVATLKLDYDLFVNSSYLRQGHADEFTVKIPAERKQILADILELSLYDRLEEKAKEKRRQLEEEEQLLSAQVIDLTARVQEKPRVEAALKGALEQKAKLESLLREKEARLKKLEDDRRKFEAVSREVELSRRRFEQLNNEVKALEQEKEEEERVVEASRVLLKEKTVIERQYRELKALRKQYEEENEKFKKAMGIQQELRLLKHQETEFQATVDRLRHVTVCPTCLRMMTKKEAETIITKLTKDFDQHVHPEQKKEEEALSKLNFDPKALEELREKLEQSEYIEERMRSIDVAKAAVEKSTKLIATNHTKVEKLMKDRVELAKKGKGLTGELGAFKEKQAQWESLEKEVGGVRSELAIAQDATGGLKNQLAQIVSVEKQIVEKDREMKKLAEKIGLFTELATSFGKKGVQAMIIEETMPQIEEGTNHLLQKITSGRMQVKFVTQRAKKSEESEVIETLDIEISDELGSRPYEQYSGGESFRINFAIRVALAKLLTLRAGAKLKFLVVDEGFGALDQSGREDIVAAISSIRQDFAKVIVVTHIEEFKNLFPTRVEVTKDSRGSHIQVFPQ